MSKAVLVIDMPKRCNECIFCKVIKTNDIWEFEENRCLFTNYNVKHSTPDKASNCPLKPMPEPVNIPEFDKTIKADNDNSYEVGAYMYARGIDIGYNMCINKILEQ